MTNNPDFDLHSYLSETGAFVNTAIEALLQSVKTESELNQALSHSFMAGGKRVRPILCIAAATAVGGDTKTILPAACALELIHTYSLIHDDLPAMDDDELRRGQPTCHIAFSEATAILAGDALLTLAFETMSHAALAQPQTAQSRWLEAILLIAKAAGWQGMVEGQMRDMAAEGRRLSLSQLKSLHSLKTGALITAAVQSGALLGGGCNGEIDALGRFARKIGLAFQVADDILNVEGDPELMGKAVGSDLEREKSTYPALLGLSQSKTLASELVVTALESLSGFDQRAEPLRAIAQYIIDRKR